MKNFGVVFVLLAASASYVVGLPAQYQGDAVARAYDPHTALVKSSLYPRKKNKVRVKIWCVLVLGSVEDC